MGTMKTDDGRATFLVQNPETGNIKKCVRAFRAYIAADGNLFAAAKIAGISKTKFYRKWPYWIATAKKSWEKSGSICH